MIKLIKTLLDLFLLLVLAVIGVIGWLSYSSIKGSDTPSPQLSKEQTQVEESEQKGSQNSQIDSEQSEARSSEPTTSNREPQNDSKQNNQEQKALDKKEEQTLSGNKLSTQELLSRDNLTSNQKRRKLNLLAERARKMEKGLPGPESIKQMSREEIRKYTPGTIEASESILAALRLADQLGRENIKKQLRDVRDRIESVKLLLQKRLFKEFNQNSSGSK